MNNKLCEKLNIAYPIIQAPMAGVSTPEMAAAVSNAGALGSISVGASTPSQAESLIRKTRHLTAEPFNVNVFCHARAERNDALETAWIERFRDVFERYGAALPAALQEIYQTFHDNDAMAEILLETAPAAVSFHFGIPPERLVHRFKSRGIITLATATSLHEARLIESAGIDFVVAQGTEAGGHRGMFDPREEDEQLSTFTLIQALRKGCTLPVIAAGGIMDGAGIAAMLKLGATGVQMGTAFVLCPESAANEAYRQALKSEQAMSTVMTSAISGRPARCVSNDFCHLTRDLPKESIPPYPLTYSLGKILAAVAAAKGAHGFGAQWAGQGVALARELPAADLVQTLVTEWQDV
ncbi:nitronate monooxygenase [Enterobacter cloacae]|uniref:NAD(P)H-dependent flavin oxidoreductase n=1 Tax=Enterobacter cloacae TaxID=550 RepID=UPI002874CD43|nr:nitronate monooxygenase [Enterobacter cloacae]MDS0060748.1 nitronate monooxygenase [Enterobacter cloacae subsp. cloacae]MDS0103741.1 nitronate monooxygenase [Enterobacter cloacae subsp. cloacae]MDW8493397.1 nitronate monooxygenase [Enterobacter cloacae subsp. cloacae]HBN6064455.1 nitronate monooxygenase [Enterobacter cloacae]